MNVLYNLYENILETVLDLIDDATVSHYEDNSDRYGIDHTQEYSKREVSDTFEINENYIFNELLMIDHESIPMEDRIRDLIFDLKDVLISIEIHNNDEKEPINGSKFFTNLYIMLLLKYKGILYDDIEISSMRDILEEYESDNKLIVNRIIGRVDNDVLNDYIVNNINSRFYLRRIFNHMRMELTNVAFDRDELEIDGNTIKLLKSLQDMLDVKLKKFNEYPSPDGHEEEGEHLLEAINNYNELVLYLFISGVINEENKTIITFITSEFIERMKHIYTKNLIEAMENIRIAYPDIFNIQNSSFYEELKNIVNMNEAKIWKFGNNGMIEPSAKDYSKLLGEDIESRGEGISKIVEKIDFEQCFDLEKALALKKNIIRCESPLERNQIEIDAYDYLYGLLYKKTNSRITYSKYVESFESSHYRTFMNFLRILQYYDSHVNLDNPSNGDDGYFDYSSVYRDDNGEPILNNVEIFYNTIGNNLKKYVESIEENNENDDNDQIEKRNFYNSTNNVKVKRGFVRNFFEKLKRNKKSSDTIKMQSHFNQNYNRYSSNTISSGSIENFRSYQEFRPDEPEVREFSSAATVPNVPLRPPPPGVHSHGLDSISQVHNEHFTNASNNHLSNAMNESFDTFGRSTRMASTVDSGNRIIASSSQPAGTSNVNNEVRNHGDTMERRAQNVHNNHRRSIEIPPRGSSLNARKQNKGKVSRK